MIFIPFIHKVEGCYNFVLNENVYNKEKKATKSSTELIYKNCIRFVCMNSLISGMMRIRAIKFDDNMTYECPQLKFILKLDHAPFQAHKSIKKTN